MDRTEIFQILGIEPTKDERAIKNAYREKLAVTNPEDDPEGFMRLRKAYEEACRLPEETESPEKPKDLSPSGLWMERVEEIYSHLSMRRDEKVWKELFHDDCFLSLDEEENCRRKLLQFLMDHFRLPTAVWKLLDKRLDIVKDAAALRERFPADFIRFIIGRVERGEDVEFGQFEGADDAPYDEFFQCYDRCWQGLQEGNLDQVRASLDKAGKLGIYHPVIDVCRAELLVRQEKGQEAIELLETLLQKYPDDAMVRYNTAEQLWRQGEKDPALRERSAEVYRTLKEDNDKHYMANLRLTEWYCDQGQYKEAKSCAEKVISAGSDPSFMELLARVNSHIEKELEAEYRESGGWEPALELCWCYLQDGKLSKGIRLALKLEKLLPPEKEAEYNGLMAKLYVEEAEYETAITMTEYWEQELRKKLAAGEDEEEAEKNRDRLRQAHLIRMQCHHNLGLHNKPRLNDAIQEGESILENSPKDIGVLLELAQIRIEKTEFDLCMELVEKLLDEYQVYAAYATALEAYSRQRDAGGVIEYGRRCIQYFPGYIKAYEYMAKVYLDLKRSDDFWKLLEAAKKNSVKSVILEAYEFKMRLADQAKWTVDELNKMLTSFRNNYLVKVEKGQLGFYDSGLPLITEMLYHFPDSYMLVERSVFHRAAHRYAEAKEDCEKALGFDPTNPYALNGLSQVYKYTGDYEKALVYIKRSILYMDREMSPVIYMDMADIYSLLGDYEMALASCRRYEQIRKQNTPEIWFQDRKAECYVNLGQTEEAIQLYQSYYQQSRFTSLRNRVDACVKNARAELGREMLDRWKAELKAAAGPGLGRMTAMKKMSSDYCSYHNMAGWLELVTGGREAALAQFEKSLRYLKDGVQETTGRLGDAVFAAAVCDDRKRGAKWAKRLGDYLHKESGHSSNPYYEKEKIRLQYDLLIEYFSDDREAMEKLLDREKSCRICWFCTSPVCKEIESMRILFLIRMGKEQEARERLVGNLEIQPADEYMLAIRHMVFGGMTGSVEG